MVSLLRHVGLLCIISYCSLTYAYSELAIKEDIIENCPRALIAARTLKTEEREELIDYLIRVLELQEYTAGEAIPDIADMGPGFNPASHEIKGPELSRVFEPARESKAKECALNVLKELGAHSWKALPSLIEVASRDKPSEDFRMVLDNTIYQISVSLATTQEILPPQQFFLALKELLFRKNSAYAENVFIELQHKCYDFLIEAFKVSVGEEQSKLRILIIRLLRGMEPVDEVQLSFVKSLTRANDPEIVGMALAVLSKSGKIDTEHFSYLLELIYDAALPLRVKSLELLGQQSARKDKVLSTFLSLLKNLPKDEDKNVRGEILLAVSTALVTLNAPKQMTPFVPYLIEALDFGPAPWDDLSSHPASKVLLGLGQKIVPALVKEGKNSSPRRKAYCALVLGQLQVAQPSVSDLLLALVADAHSGVRAVARSALIPISSKVRAGLEKRFLSSVPPLRFYYAEAIVFLSFDSKEARQVLEHAFNSGSCADKVEYGRVLSRVSGAIGNDGVLALVSCIKTDKELALSALRTIRTFGSVSEDAWEQMWDILPDLKSNRALFDEMLISMSQIRPNSKELKDYFTAELTSGDCESAMALIPKLDGDAAVQVVSHALQEIPPEKRSLVIRVAGNIGRVDQGILQQIRSLVASSDLEMVTEVTIALLKTDPNFPELANAVKRIASSKHSGELAKEIFPREAQAVLKAALLASESRLERTALVSSMRG